LLKGTQTTGVRWSEDGVRRGRQSSGERPKEPNMDLTTILIIVVVVLLLGGGGWYGRGRWY
jgi:hypothetical protein